MLAVNAGLCRHVLCVRGVHGVRCVHSDEPRDEIVRVTAVGNERLVEQPARLHPVAAHGPLGDA